MTRWFATTAILSLAIAPASAETLRGAVMAAYEGNPQLAAARARQDAIAETPKQARAAGRLTAETRRLCDREELRRKGAGERDGLVERRL